MLTFAAIADLSVNASFRMSSGLFTFLFVYLRFPPRSGSGVSGRELSGVLGRELSGVFNVVRS